MNLENFHDFISEPSELYRISYQELKSLVMQYPYSYNLRLLLLRKSKIENHPDYEKNLRIAACFARDRSLLYDQMKKESLLVREENFVINEDFLELKDLTELGFRLREKIDEVEKTSQDEEYLQYQDEEKTREETDLTPQEQEDDTVSPNEESDTINYRNSSITKEEEEPEEQVSAGNDSGTIETTVTPAESPIFEKEKEKKNKKRQEQESAVVSSSNAIQPQPKTSFTSWRTLYSSSLTEIFPSPVDISSLDKPGVPPHPKKIKHPSEAQLVAEKSLYENDEIISETLAELLVKQEQFEKAIIMYEKLGLKFPEKSALFAQRIENLKKI